MIRGNLLDLNVLIALLDPAHSLHQKAESWFISSGRENWGICPLTEAGFVRVTTSPVMQSNQRTVAEALTVLQELATRPGYRYWPMTEAWIALTAPFVHRILGHQQVTDAYLLGLAIKEDGVLVTFDRGLLYLAGSEFRQNLLVLE